MTGATRFTDYNEYPMITTGLPSYDTESRAYARYLTKEMPDAKIAIKVDGGRMIEARVVALPFYDSDAKRQEM